MNILDKYTNIAKKDVSEIFKFSGMLLKEFPENLKDDKDVVILAVTKSWHALQYASTRLKTDMDILKIAVDKQEDALQYVTNDILNNDNLMRILINVNAKVIKYSSDTLKNDRDLILSLVTRNGVLLEHASDELKTDKTVALAAIENHYTAIKYVSDDLKDSKDIILFALNKNVDAYFSLPYTHTKHAWYEYTVRNFRKIKNEDKPLVTQALLTQEEKFLNPPAVIKELTNSMEYPYVVLAMYALGIGNEVYTEVELPVFEL